ncbi:flagellar hook-basal body complex protein [Neobacillus drentensis]|uniref:flagellar hook-basal body complex protein n=1 Tax=Neobacillus drentensis TaxID=220684 RepID=UPI002864D48E|nr:flagellar hook-basal body complex protein [Neobacillus drentensis]MDR7235672.1 flagellar hook protein FlgE [Neobacillus drentensis]
MLKSLYSGISGMKGFQTKLDVIGNNVANVNTVGFKKSRVIFQDIINQNIAGATSPTTQSGGINPKQIGLGTKIASIDTVHTPGSPMTTNVGTDLAIDGDAFFVVSPEDPSNGGSSYLTKAGNFTRDANGDLVNSNGFFVSGAVIENPPPLAPVGTPGILHQIPINISVDESSNLDASGNVIKIGTFDQAPTKFTSYSIDSYGYINVVDENGNSGKLAMGMDPTNKKTFGKYYLNSSAGNVNENISLATSIVTNPGGLKKVGNTMFEVTGNAEAGGKAAINRIENNSGGTINSGILEMSNVDLTEEFTEMIVAQRGFQANARTITTSDSILEEVVNLKR